VLWSRSQRCNAVMATTAPRQIARRRRRRKEAAEAASGSLRKPPLTCAHLYFVVLARANPNPLVPRGGSTVRSADDAPKAAPRSPRRRRLRRADEDQIVALYTSGMGSLDVADRLGFGKTTVLNVLARRGIERRAQGRRLS
jgi:hypothetical protein